MDEKHPLEEAPSHTMQSAEAEPLDSSDAAFGQVAENRGNALRLRAIGPIIRAAGLVPWTMAFAILFVAATLVVDTAEPSVEGFANAAWLNFQVVTTIGLGDFTCTSLAGRLAAIALSVYSVFFLALVTGAMVAYCNERMAARRDESVAHFLDQLEHLEDLSPDDLASLSGKIRRLRSRQHERRYSR